MTGENFTPPEQFHGDDIPYGPEERRWVRDIMDESIEPKLAEHKDWVAHVPATPEDDLAKDVLLLAATTEQKEDVLITVAAHTSLPHRPKIALVLWLAGARAGAMSEFVEGRVSGVVTKLDTEPDVADMQDGRIAEIVEERGGDTGNLPSIIAAGLLLNQEDAPNKTLEQSAGIKQTPASLKDMRWLEALIATGEPVPPELLGYTRA